MGKGNYQLPDKQNLFNELELLRSELKMKKEELVLLKEKRSNQDHKFMITAVDISEHGKAEDLLNDPLHTTLKILLTQLLGSVNC